MRNVDYMIALIGFWILVACSSSPKDVSKVDALPEIYPDYVGVTIPVGIAPLNFAMTDEAFETIDVEVKGSKAGSLHANGDYVDFDIDAWHQLLEQNKGGSLTFTVCAKKDGRWIQYKDFIVDVSADPLEAWGITYRRIPPSYEMYSQMGLYQRDLSNFDEMELLQNTRTPNQCVNCHTANRTNPDQYLFHIRGDHGATAIKSEKREVDSEALELSRPPSLPTANGSTSRRHRDRSIPPTMIRRNTASAV